MNRSGTTVGPWEGPREPLRFRLLTVDQRDKVLGAIGFLEDAQVSILAAEGNSAQRTTICQALAKLYNLTSPVTP